MLIIKYLDCQCVFTWLSTQILFHFQYMVQKQGLMGSPGSRSDVNKGVLFWTEIIQAKRDHNDIEWRFIFVPHLNTIFRSFPQLACLF